MAALRVGRMEPEGAKTQEDWSGGFSRVPGVSEALFALVDRTGRARNPSDPRECGLLPRKCRRVASRWRGARASAAGRVGECGGQEAKFEV